LDEPKFPYLREVCTLSRQTKIHLVRSQLNVALEALSFQLLTHPHIKELVLEFKLLFRSNSKPLKIAQFLYFIHTQGNLSLQATISFSHS